MIHNEIRSIKLSNPDALTIIRISDPDRDPQFQRIHKGEFRYKGKMYDIISESYNGSTYTYLCYHDKREDNIFKSLKKEALDSFNSSWWNYQIKVAFPVIFSPFCLMVPLDFPYPCPVSILTQVPQRILTPPPEQA